MVRKGETLSRQSIDKINKTKQAKLLSSYNWIIVEPYLDIELNNGSVNRTNRYVTLREFKEKIQSGFSIKEIKNEGVSKKVLQFFSNFCQGKINLTKEQFLECYNKGMSLDEISKEYSVTREDTTFLRQLYDVKRKGATFIKRKQTETLLTKRQKEILYGSMMGDAKRLNPKWNSIVHFKQCLKQKDYLMWKYLEFQNIVKEGILKFDPPSLTDKREEFKGSTGHWEFYTKANTDVEECLKEFYKSGKKEVSEKILENFSPLSIAVWYMDDGTAGFSKKTREKTGWKIAPEIRFCTDSFSKESCDRIVKWFKEKYNIVSHLRENGIRKDGGIRYRVIINSVSAYDLFSLIRPYIVPCMLYKIGE